MAHPGRATRRARFSLAALVVGDAVLAGLALGFAVNGGGDPEPNRETVVITTAPPSVPAAAGNGPAPADVVAATGGTPAPSSTTTSRGPAVVSPSTSTAITSTEPHEAAETPSSTTTEPPSTTEPVTTTVVPEPTEPSVPPVSG